VAGRDKVTVAMCYGQWHGPTVRSITAMVQHDLTRGGRHLDHPDSFIYVQTTNIASGRNTCVRTFLEGGADWLLFLDTDQESDPNLLDLLIDSADAKTRPVLSGLIMARREHDRPISPACVILDDHDPPRPIRPQFVPNVRHWPVAGVGAGCLLIHRTVLEKIRTEFADREPREWFEYTLWQWTDDDGNLVKDEMGEDYVFSMRAMAVGVTPIVDTTITLGHIKPLTLTRELFHQQYAQAGSCPTYVVIPVKDRLDLTRPLVEELRAQHQFDGLLVFDNGSGAETKQWLAEQPDMLAFDAKGAGIHDMWNAGIEYALRTSGGLCNVVFLNNDLKIGPDFIEGLVKALREGPWIAVSPNYDNRPSRGTPVERVQGICAERYDGTGGLAGFAFAVRGELFAQGYRFPQDAKWWFGDNDFTLTCDSSNLTYGIAVDTTVEHIGAGTAGDWNAKKWSKALAADREAFLAKWQPMGVTL
jgi:GT2 family glycosyltransferase